MRALVVSSYIGTRIRQKRRNSCLDILSLKPKRQGESRSSHCFSFAECSKPIHRTNDHDLGLACRTACRCGSGTGSVLALPDVTSSCRSAQTTHPTSGTSIAGAVSVAWRHRPRGPPASRQRNGAGERLTDARVPERLSRHPPRSGCLPQPGMATSLLQMKFSISPAQTAAFV